MYRFQAHYHARNGSVTMPTCSKYLPGLLDVANLFNINEPVGAFPRHDTKGSVRDFVTDWNAIRKT